MNIYSIEHWVKKGLTTHEAENKVKDLFERTNRYCKEFWMRRGYTEEESKKQISEIQRKNALKVDNKNKPTTTRIDYWIKMGYDENEARKKLKERQSTFTLEKCVKKYGEIEGRKIFNERQIRWQKSLVENNNIKELNNKKGIKKEEFIKKHGEDKYNKLIEIRRITNSKNGYIDKFGEKKYEERIKKIIESTQKNFHRISKISISLFEKIEKEITDKCFYGKNEKILQYYDETGNYKCFYADFMVNNKIIEFYGDYWHGNPQIYENNDIIGSRFKYAEVKDIRKNDEERIKLIKDMGYDVLLIWENEYKNDMEKIKNNCVEWIKK